MDEASALGQKRPQARCGPAGLPPPLEGERFPRSPATPAPVARLHRPPAPKPSAALGGFPCGPRRRRLSRSLRHCSPGQAALAARGDPAPAPPHPTGEAGARGSLGPHHSRGHLPHRTGSRPAPRTHQGLLFKEIKEGLQHGAPLPRSTSGTPWRAAGPAAGRSRADTPRAGTRQPGPAPPLCGTHRGARARPPHASALTGLAAAPLRGAGPGRAPPPPPPADRGSRFRGRGTPRNGERWAAPRPGSTASGSDVCRGAAVRRRGAAGLGPAPVPAAGAGRRGLRSAVPAARRRGRRGPVAGAARGLPVLGASGAASAVSRASASAGRAGRPGRAGCAWPCGAELAAEAPLSAEGPGVRPARSSRSVASLPWRPPKSWSRARAVSGLKRVETPRKTLQTLEFLVKKAVVGTASSCASHYK